MVARSFFLMGSLLFCTSSSALAQDPHEGKSQSLLIRGKTLDAWIQQASTGPTLEERHTALQVLRNDGVGRDRKATLRAFTDLLGSKEPTVQSLAAAGIRKAGRPTDPNAPERLSGVLVVDLTSAKPSIDNNDAAHQRFALAVRVIRALGTVGNERQVETLRSISDNEQVHGILRQLASQAIEMIEKRSTQTARESTNGSVDAGVHKDES